jgi:hypothetical protein
MGQYFAADLLEVSDDKGFADDGKKDAMEELDDCYVSDPERPKGKAKPDYRSVKFTLSVPEIENAEATFGVRPLA